MSALGIKYMLLLFLAVLNILLVLGVTTLSSKVSGKETGDKVSSNGTTNSTTVTTISEPVCYEMYKSCVDIAMNSDHSYVEMCEALLTCTDSYFECRGTSSTAEEKTNTTSSSTQQLQSTM